MRRCLPRLKTILANQTRINPDRFLELAIIGVREDAKIANCDPGSIAKAVFTAAKIGLEVNTPRGHAYLVPYKGQCTLLIGYKGLLELAYRTSAFIHIDTQIVREKDQFEYWFDPEPNLKHRPAFLATPPNEMIGVWGTYRLRNGGIRVEVMTRKQIEEIRDRAPSGQSPAWRDSFDEMARKTVLRRLLKTAPLSEEFAQAVAAEDEQELEIVASQPEVRGARTEALAQKLMGSTESDPSQETAALTHEAQEDDDPDQWPEGRE